jgi:TnpA family transposase
MVKYATALRLGVAETESILRRFTRGNLQHPTYKALAELGKTMKAIFLCRYLHSLKIHAVQNAQMTRQSIWTARRCSQVHDEEGARSGKLPALPEEPPRLL